jgi:SagB-type dehydrogenase family enzyme
MFRTIHKYHEATKHHFHRYARSAGFMDWDNQPNPFRLYEGAPLAFLPLGPSDPVLPYAGLFEPPGAPEPLEVASISRFLLFSLGLSAWKAAGGSFWSLRMNPSSGNLHPTESHLILPALKGFEAGLYHYNPLKHALEQRGKAAETHVEMLARDMGGPGFVVALTTIFWREAWKYGERSYRYCNLDAGHALAALALSARLNHWRLRPLSDMGDGQVRRLLGLD